MGGIIAMTYAMDHGQRLRALVLNDIGPEVEQGSQRITGMVRDRPDEFAHLEDAMTYRREISPIVAARNAADQRELALGVLRRLPDGKWGWKMDPAYIRQRVERGAPVRPNLWPTLARLACPTLVVWVTDSDVLSEVQARRMGRACAEPGRAGLARRSRRFPAWRARSSGHLGFCQPLRQSADRAVPSQGG
jgi:pimeloyl-ACP methyl ester carboxylesterase